MGYGGRYDFVGFLEELVVGGRDMVAGVGVVSGEEVVEEGG